MHNTNSLWQWTINLVVAWPWKLYRSQRILMRQMGCHRISLIVVKFLKLIRRIFYFSLKDCIEAAVFKIMINKWLLTYSKIVCINSQKFKRSILSFRPVVGFKMARHLTGRRGSWIKLRSIWLSKKRLAIVRLKSDRFRSSIRRNVSSLLKKWERLRVSISRKRNRLTDCDRRNWRNSWLLDSLSNISNLATVKSKMNNWKDLSQ